MWIFCVLLCVLCMPVGKCIASGKTQVAFFEEMSHSLLAGSPPPVLCELRRGDQIPILPACIAASCVAALSRWPSACSLCCCWRRRLEARRRISCPRKRNFRDVRRTIPAHLRQPLKALHRPVQQLVSVGFSIRAGLCRSRCRQHVAAHRRATTSRINASVWSMLMARERGAPCRSTQTAYRRHCRGVMRRARARTPRAVC
mmetsp:Transcript_23097/g.66162  ORF Transcript_23097/g.66162 Transcript_23097/m.66162 type:complete len:201 (-) Transcript_23097:1485-2087(-)